MDEKQFVLDYNKIKSKEPELFQALMMTVHHISETYSDKYEVTGDTVIDTKKFLYNKDMGKYINIYQVNRYLQRILSSGKKKSDLFNDLFKAVHYLMFEITRRIKLGEVNNIEYKN